MDRRADLGPAQPLRALAGERRLLVVVARWPWRLGGERALSVPGQVWRGSTLQWGGGAGPWRDVLAPGGAPREQRGVVLER